MAQLRVLWEGQPGILALAAALAAGALIFVLVQEVLRAPRGGKLAAYRAPTAASAPPDINSSLGLGRPASARFLPLIVVAAVAALLALGLPLVPALGGGGLVYVLADEFFKTQQRKARLAIESELPTFVSRLGGMLLVIASPRAAVEEITATLEPERPLRRWLERLLAGWQQQGDGFLAQAHLEANAVTPLLGQTVYRIRRLNEAGTAGATRAFALTAEELSAILEARAVAGAKAEGARTAVLTMLLIMGVILVLMLSSPTIRQGYATPTAQLVAAVALGVMGFGYVFLNGMINEALEV